MDVPFAAQSLSWVGASVYGTLEGSYEGALTRETYVKGSFIPDWCAIPQTAARSFVLTAAFSHTDTHTAPPLKKGGSVLGGLIQQPIRATPLVRAE